MHCLNYLLWSYNKYCKNNTKIFFPSNAKIVTDIILDGENYRELLFSTLYFPVFLKFQKCFPKFDILNHSTSLPFSFSSQITIISHLDYSHSLLCGLTCVHPSPGITQSLHSSQGMLFKCKTITPLLYILQLLHTVFRIKPKFFAVTSKADLSWPGSSHAGLLSVPQTLHLFPWQIFHALFPWPGVFCLQHLRITGSCYSGLCWKATFSGRPPHFLKVASFSLHFPLQCFTLLNSLHGLYHHLKWSSPFIYLLVLYQSSPAKYLF